MKDQISRKILNAKGVMKKSSVLFEKSLIILFFSHSHVLLKVRPNNYLKNDALAIEYTSTYFFKILKVE